MTLTLVDLLQFFDQEAQYGSRYDWKTRSQGSGTSAAPYEIDSIGAFHRTWVSIASRKLSYEGTRDFEINVLNEEIEEKIKQTPLAHVRLLGLKFVVSIGYWVYPEGDEGPRTYEAIIRDLEESGMDDEVISDMLEETINGQARALLGNGDKRLLGEIALAIFGAENARNRRSFGMARMMTQIAGKEANDFPDACDTRRKLSWANALVCTDEPSVLLSRLGAKGLTGRLEALRKHSKSQHREESIAKAYAALWGGDLPMAHAGSEFEGGQSVEYLSRVDQMNIVQLKEAHLIRRWLYVTKQEDYVGKSFDSREDAELLLRQKFEKLYR